MDTLGSYDPDQQEILDQIKFAVTRVLHNWGRSLDERDDLVQEVWTWYLARPSTQAIVAREGNNKTFVRNIFYKGAQQLLSAQVTKSTEMHYSSDAIKDWLSGASTNKFLGKMIQAGLDKLSYNYREAIRNRYELGIIPPRVGKDVDRLKNAHISLTTLVNAAFGEAQEGDPKWKRPSSVSADRRRMEGGYNDTTASQAFALIASGDDVLELENGDSVTLRSMLEEPGLTIGVATGGGRAEWIDLFEGSVNDRTDMYRAQVFPELYPNEPRMLIENWHPEDRAAYVGGEYTEGYRRLRVVR